MVKLSLKASFGGAEGTNVSVMNDDKSASKQGRKNASADGFMLSQKVRLDFLMQLLSHDGTSLLLSEDDEGFVEDTAGLQAIISRPSSQRHSSFFFYFDFAVPPHLTKADLDEFVKEMSEPNAIITTSIIHHEQVSTYRLIVKPNDSVPDDEDFELLMSLCEVFSKFCLHLQIGSESDANSSDNSNKGTAGPFRLPSTIDDLLLRLSLQAETDDAAAIKAVTKDESSWYWLILLLLDDVHLQLEPANISMLLSALGQEKSRFIHGSYWWFQRFLSLSMMIFHKETFCYDDDEGTTRTYFLDVLSMGMTLPHTNKVLHGRFLPPGPGLGRTHAEMNELSDIQSDLDALLSTNLSLRLETDPSCLFYLEQVAGRAEAMGRKAQQRGLSVMITDADGDQVQIQIPRKDYTLLKEAAAEELEIDPDQILKFCKKKSGTVVKKQSHMESIEYGEFLEVVLSPPQYKVDADYH